MAHITRDIVVIGASAGGVQALQELVAGLPVNFPASVFVVLHTWPGRESYLGAILSRAGPLPAEQPKDSAPIARGKIYVAPSDYHMFVEDSRVLVLRGPRENRFRPAINPLFRSAAAAYRNRVIGIILTGMLDDGAAGLWAIKRCGGIAIVQSDPAFDQMPQAALNNVEIDYHVRLAEIPALLDRLVREPVAPESAPPVPEVVQFNDQGAKMKPSDFPIAHVGRRSLFTCPECHGALWEVQEGNQRQFRCHVGHAYTSDGLRDAQHLTIEQSLWSAMRALRESAALDERLAERAREQGLEAALAIHQANAQKKFVHAEEIRGFLHQLRPEE